KLVFLYISTLGTYTIYWFYKHWKLIEPRMEEKIMPFWRAVFFIFFAHSLFGRVETEARKRSLALSWSAGSLAGIFVILTVAQRIVDRISMRSQTVGYVEALSIGLMLSCIWPIIVVQKTANQAILRICWLLLCLF
ncbi:MAG TPA: hypothetical protein PK937_14475, partial [bacterium]|nr:hypothetical protein [bacterium]